MNAVNIREIRISPEFMRLAVANADSERIIEDPSVNKKKLAQYTGALLKANELFTPDRGYCSYDDPEATYNYHTLTVKFIDEEFDGDDFKTLTEIISAFDGVMFYSNTNQEVFMQLIIDDVYTPKGT